MHNKNNSTSGASAWHTFAFSCVSTALVLMSSAPQTAEAVYRDARFNAAPQLNQLIVKYRDGGMNAASRGVMSAGVLDNVSAKMGRSMNHRRWLGEGAQLVTVVQADGAASMGDVIDAIKADSRVEYVVRDIMYQPAATPTDPLFAEQWHYLDGPGGIRVDAAWDVAYPDGFEGESRLEPVVVAVIDSGSRPHEDLLDITLPGYDFIDNPFIAADGDGRDDDATDVGDYTAPGDCGPNWPGSPSVWHGAHVMGTVGAVTNNGTGGAGVAPNARIVPIRALGRCGGALSDVIDSIYWAAGIDVPGVPSNENPAKVINLSLAAPGFCNAAMQSAVSAARDAGAVVVVAAGNEAIDAANLSPANCVDAFTVASVHAEGGRAVYSNFGDLVEIAAPGGNGPVFNPPDAGVISTVDAGTTVPVQDAYGALVGTSMAAPHVAGVAAMVFGAQPDWSPAQVENLLMSTVRDFPQNCEGCGVGIVDASQALALALPPIEEPEEEVELPEEEVIPEEDIEPIEEEIEEEEIPQELPVVDLGLFILGANTSVVPDGEIVDEAGRELSQRVTEYAISVRNLSLNQAQAVTVTNIIPDAVELVSLDISQGTCSVDGALCEVGDLAGLGQVELSFTVTHYGPSTVEALLGLNPSDIVIEDLYIQTQVSADNVDQVTENNNFVQPLVGGQLGWLGLIGLLIMAGRRRCLRAYHENADK